MKLCDELETDNPVTQHDLGRIDKLVASDIFLKALGNRSREVPLPDGFPIQTNILLIGELMTCQAVYDLQEPWPYQYFTGIIEDGVPGYEYVSYEEYARIRKLFLTSKTLDELGEKISILIDERYERYGIREFLFEKASKQTKQNIIVEECRIPVPDIVDCILPNAIHGMLGYLVETAYLGGIEKSLVYKRFYDAFQTGGIPCGWIGPLPENGGDPKECLQLLHYGNRGNRESGDSIPNKRSAKGTGLVS